jgi:hypothetical protein
MRLTFVAAMALATSCSDVPHRSPIQKLTVCQTYERLTTLGKVYEPGGVPSRIDPSKLQTYADLWQHLSDVAGETVRSSATVVAMSAARAVQLQREGRATADLLVELLSTDSVAAADAVTVTLAKECPS